MGLSDRELSILRVLAMTTPAVLAGEPKVPMLATQVGLMTVARTCQGRVSHILRRLMESGLITVRDVRGWCAPVGASNVSASGAPRLPTVGAAKHRAYLLTDAGRAFLGETDGVSAPDWMTREGLA